MNILVVGNDEDDVAWLGAWFRAPDATGEQRREQRETREGSSLPLCRSRSAHQTRHECFQGLTHASLQLQLGFVSCSEEDGLFEVCSPGKTAVSLRKWCRRLVIIWSDGEWEEWRQRTPCTAWLHATILLMQFGGFPTLSNLIWTRSCLNYCLILYYINLTNLTNLPDLMLETV